MIKKDDLLHYVKIISLIFIILSSLIVFDFYVEQKNIEYFLNDLYLKKRAKEHILICSYSDYGDDNYKISCKNSFKFFSGSIVEKKFLSDEYLEKNYKICIVTRYRGHLNTNYLIGWFSPPSAETRKELTSFFMNSNKQNKYIDKVFDYVFE